MISKEASNKIITCLGPYNPSMIGIFGSYARGENKDGSDLDILVEFNTTINLLEIIGIESHLSEVLGVKVDLVTKRSLHPDIRPFVEKDLEIILNDKK